MKILVTGGAGYIGSHATYLLIEKGYDVVVVDNLSRGFKSNIHPQAKFYQADIRSYQDIKNVFENEKDIVAIMNFAGLIVVPESVEQPIEYFDNNTNGVLNLLNVAKDYDVQTFIFSSSAAVYGEPQSIPIKEDDIKEPINPYGNSKLAAEYIIRDWANAYKRNYVIFRYFNVAGAHDNGLIGIKGKGLTHLLPLVISAALDPSKTFTIFGNDYQTKDGTCIRDFVHVNDLVEAHILGMEWSLKNHTSDIFNLGKGDGYSVLEVLNESIKVLNIDIKNLVGPRRAGDPAQLYSDTTKVKSILNWEPKIKLDKIITSEYQFRKKLNENN